MAWSQKRWLDLLAAILIGAVFIIVIGEEVFGMFFQKPVGGILTLITVSILGYFSFFKIISMPFKAMWSFSYLGTNGVLRYQPSKP